MRKKLAFAALLLPFIAAPAMAQTAGALFPPANEPVCISSAGVSGVLAWTGQRLECRPFNIPVCPSGQVIQGVVGGAVKCAAVSPMVNLGTCTGKKIVRGIQNGQLVCADNMVAASCPSGQFVTGFTADGGVTCASPAKPEISSCAQGQVVIGTSADGKPVCGTQGDSSTGGTVTNPNASALTSCVGNYCNGTNNIIFPGRNAAGAKSDMPARCRGTWWADLRGARWDSSCSTGFELLTSCSDDNGRAIANCPDQTANPATTLSVSCTDFVCKGFNSKVNFTNNALNKNTVVTCKGEWTANVRDKNWTSTCSTGWEKVAGWDEPAPGQQTTTPETGEAPVPCVNATCSGKDDVVFPVRNAVGAINPYPYYCKGEWASDVRGANWNGNCSSTYVELKDCTDPRTKKKIANCPDATEAPAQTQSATCMYQLCKGRNTRVMGSNGAGRAETATCLGEWTADLRGSNWISSCSTEWKDLQSQQTSAPTPTATATPVATPTATPTATPATTTRITACIDNRCEGADGIIFPVRNAIGGINKYPYYCKGAWTADVRGPRWLGSCSTGSVELTSCVDPATKLRIPNCPDMTPPPAQTLNANCYGVCKGRNTRVTGVNAEGKGAIATCKGEWNADVSGKNWKSSCSTGWIDQTY